MLHLQVSPSESLVRDRRTRNSGRTDFRRGSAIDATSMIDIGLFSPKTQQFDFKVKRTSFARRFLRVHTHKPNGAPGTVLFRTVRAWMKQESASLSSFSLETESAHAISACS
jgi:hypothetical protein